MSSRRVRTPGDQARARLFYHGKALRKSGRRYPDRETLLERGGSVDALLFHMTADDIRRLDDDTAIMLDQWDPGLDGSRPGPAFIQEVLEPDPEDDFFSLPDEGRSDEPTPMPDAQTETKKSV